uniref:Bidirectional sugar transporter SWEET n=1 Tax=Aegilops tauschii TaxID=37682 RepID=M8BNW4_AEGTA
MDFEMFLRWTGYVSMGFILLAPGITFVWNKKVACYTPYLYLAMSFNGVLRVLYVMVTKGDVVIMYINGGGVLLELVYTAIFISLAAAADRRRANLLRSIVPGLLILILGGICYLTSATAYRLLCAICGTALYIVPMIDVVKVIKLKKRKYMPPLLLASTSFLNSIICVRINPRYAVHPPRNKQSQTMKTSIFVNEVQRTRLLFGAMTTGAPSRDTATPATRALAQAASTPLRACRYLVVMGYNVGCLLIYKRPRLTESYSTSLPQTRRRRETPLLLPQLQSP